MPWKMCFYICKKKLKKKEKKKKDKGNIGKTDITIRIGISKPILNFDRNTAMLIT